MSENIKLFDTSRCTGCRGCQLACKQWNNLPAKQTVNWGSYQNPPTLQSNTYLIMRFQEKADANSVKWFFRHEACMHCTDAACVKACPTGALYYSEFKTVGKNIEKCIGCKDCVAACPFEVPKYDSGANKVLKCDMCESRIANKLEPACVKACPTGALKWGEKETMLKIANERVKELGGDAHVYGPQYVGGTHLAYILQEKGCGLCGPENRSEGSAFRHCMEGLVEAAESDSGRRCGCRIAPALHSARSQAAGCGCRPG